jgi:hypothetical protein
MYVTKNQDPKLKKRKIRYPSEAMEYLQFQGSTKNPRTFNEQHTTPNLSRITSQLRPAF